MADFMGDCNSDPLVTRVVSMRDWSQQQQHPSVPCRTVVFSANFARNVAVGVRSVLCTDLWTLQGPQIPLFGVLAQPASPVLGSRCVWPMFMTK